MILLFCPSILQFLASFAGTLPSSRLEFSSTFGYTLGCSSVTVCSNSSFYVPFFVSRTPNNSCTISGPHPACPFFLPSHDLPNVVFPFFQTFGQEFWSSTSSWHFHVFASSSTYHTSTPVCFRTPLCSMLRFLSLNFVNETPLFFRFWLELFTVLPLFYQAVEAGRNLQSCTHLLSFLLHSFCFRIHLKSFVQHVPCFSQLISLLIASSDKLPNMRHICHFLFCAVCLHMLHFHQNVFLPDHVILPTCFHNSASPAFGLMHVLPPLLNPSIIPLMSTWTLTGPTTLFQKALEGRQLRPLDGALDLEPCLHCTVHPKHGPHLSIMIQLHHCPTTSSPFFLLFPAVTRPWQHGP